MITIIGGGVFGLTIGWYLAREGQSVTLFEQDHVGRGATWVAAGMLMPWKLSNSFSMALFNLQRESHNLWPGFVRELQSCSDIDVHYQTDGRYFVALDEKAEKRFKKQFDFHRKAGFPLEWLSGDEARCREPGLGPNIKAAMFSPLGHVVDNRRLVAALKSAFLRAGGTLREQARVSKILVEDSRVRGVCLDNEVVPATAIILAAGAGISQIDGLPAGLRALVQPLKGQTLTLQMGPDRPVLNHPIIGPVYLVPRPDGRLLVGTTVEEDAGFNTTATVAGVYHMLKKALAIVPGLKKLPICEMGAGLRPTGPNRVPLLGPTGINSLILAAGGHSHGILLSPIVAQSIMQLLLTGQIPKNITSFVPDSPIHGKI